MPSSTISRSSFEEFYEVWYPRAVRAARQRGLRDAEAVASDIMITFFETDYLDQYDPTRKGATTFESWVNHIMYLRLNNAHRAQRRQPQTVTMTLDWEGRIEPSPQKNGGRTIGITQDHQALGVEQDRHDLDFSELCKKVYQLIKVRYGEDLAGTWVSVVKQVAEDTTARSGILRQWLTAKHLRIAQKTVTGKVDALRNVILEDEELRELLGANRSLATV